MIPQELINKARMALRITTNGFDNQIASLLSAGMKDLGFAGVEARLGDETTELALITFVCAKFGQPSNYNELMQSYNDYKTQMSVSSDYTDWGDLDV